jgi:hypothetical protein
VNADAMLVQTSVVATPPNALHVVRHLDRKRCNSDDDPVRGTLAVRRVGLIG